MLKRLTSSANVRLGRHLFRNGVTAANNLKGRADLLYHRMASGYRGNGVDAEVSQWRQVGFLPLMGEFDAALIAAIHDRFNDLIADNNAAYTLRLRGKDGFKRSILSPHAAIPETRYLMTDRIRRLIEAYYGSYFRVLHLHCWRNYHVPDDLARQHEWISNYWHFDERRTSTVRLFVALSDITEDDGPFHIQPLNRSRELVRRGWLTRDRPVVPEAELEDTRYVHRFVGPAGSAILCNTELCIHRAGLPAAGRQRDMLDIQCVPASQPLPDDWPDHVVPKRTERRERARRAAE